MKRNASHKSKPPIMKPITSKTIHQTTSTRWQCPDQDYEGFELTEFSCQRKQGENACEDGQWLTNQNHQAVHEGKLNLVEDVEDNVILKAVEKLQERNDDLVASRNHAPDNAWNLAAVATPDREKRLIFTQNVPRRRRYQANKESLLDLDKKRISEQVRQIRAETRAILEETRRFLEGSDDEKSHYRRESGRERIERAEIRKIRAETQAIREETRFIKAETRAWIDTKRAQSLMKEGHVRYSL